MALIPHHKIPEHLRRGPEQSNNYCVLGENKLASTMANDSPPSYHEIHGTPGTSTTQSSTGVVSQGQSGPSLTPQQGSSAIQRGATPQEPGTVPMATPQGPGMIPVGTPQGPGMIPVGTPQGPHMVPMATPQGPGMMIMPGQSMAYVSSNLSSD